MKRKYIIRHKILEYLFAEASKEEDPQIPKRLISSVEISKNIKIPLKEIILFHELLHERGEIGCYYDEKGHEMSITIKGRQSFLDKKYLKEGKKDYWNSIYDPLKIIIPILTLILSVLALVLNQNLKNELKRTQRELDLFKQNIENTQK